MLAGSVCVLYLRSATAKKGAYAAARVAPHASACFTRAECDKLPSAARQEIASVPAHINP